MVTHGGIVNVIVGGIKQNDVKRSDEISLAVTSLKRVAHFQYAQGEVKIDVHATQHSLTISSGEIHIQILLDEPGLATRVDSYVEVCRGIEGHSLASFRGDSYRTQLHNQGAEAISSLCRKLGPDFQTARRLFSLVVALAYSPPLHTLPQRL